VEGMRGLPVYIWKDDWEGMMRRTGSKPEYGECSAEFSPLGPGTYMVEPEGLGVWADVELTGLEVMWLDFRRKAVPSSPHIVEKLAPPPAEEVAPPAPTQQAEHPAQAAPPVRQEPPPPRQERVCALVLAAPQEVETLKALLRHVAQGRIGVVDTPEEALAYDRALVIGDEREDDVAAALASLRQRGLAAEAVFEGFGDLSI